MRNIAEGMEDLVEHWRECGIHNIYTDTGACPRVSLGLELYIPLPRYSDALGHYLTYRCVICDRMRTETPGYRYTLTQTDPVSTVDICSDCWTALRP